MILAKKFGPQKLSKSTKEDPILFKDLLSIMCVNGAPIANITHSLQDYFCWSDACNHCMGGFNSTGKAWQWSVTKKYIDRISINHLEFIAFVVTIMMILKGKKKDSNVFAFTDSSSDPWLRMNFLFFQIT